MIKKHSDRRTLESRIARLERTLRAKNEGSWEHNKMVFKQTLDLVKLLDEFGKLNKEMRDFAKDYAASQAEDDWYDDDGYAMDTAVSDYGNEIRDILRQFVDKLNCEELASEIIYDHMNTK